jgi:hypothetical protein
VQAEHARSHDLGTNALEECGGVRVIDARCAGAAGVTEDALVERAGRDISEKNRSIRTRVMSGSLRSSAGQVDAELVGLARFILGASKKVSQSKTAEIAIQETTN